MAVVGAFMPLAAAAQAVSFLNISPDPRTQAMGGASVAAEASAFSIYNNPAAIALSEDTFALAASYNMWQVVDASSDLLSFATYYKLGDKFGVGASYRGFAQPSYDIYDDQGNHSGEFSPSDSSFDVALSCAFTDSFAVGVTFKSISSTLGESISGSSFGVDLGVTYILDRATLAASYSNMGSISYDDNSYSLPSIFKVGGSYRALDEGEHSCSVNVQANMLTSESAFGLGVGGEYGFNKMIFARLGYYLSGDDSVMPSYISLGLGVEFSKISLDCSYLIDDVISPLNLSLGYRF